MKNKRLIYIFAAIAGLLSVPLIAMQFTDEVVWAGGDFFMMAILLTVTGLLAELVIRKIKTKRNRLIGVAIVLFLFFLVYAEMAVGIFGTPVAGN